MSIMQQTRYVFHLAQNIHLHLSKIYHNLSNHSERERLKILLDYMSHQEELMKSCIEEYEKCLPKKVMDTWFKYAPKDLDMDYAKIINLAPDIEVDDIITLALEIDDKLIEMFSDMSKSSDCESVKEAFSNLKKLEYEKKKNLVRSCVRFEDL